MTHQREECERDTAGKLNNEIANWADSQQYRAEQMPQEIKDDRLPRVTLLNATPDPLGSLAALCAIYSGRVVRELSEVTDAEREQALRDMSATALSGPLEAIQFHFLIEGVDRSFTHQAVRGRNAFYAQESMRFAVVDNEEWEDRSTLPPTVAGTVPGSEYVKNSSPYEDMSQEQRLRGLWDQAMSNAQRSYNDMISAGMPAEEARGTMPHSVMTRYHWVCSLRELLHVAGLRTCTQAQFHWRLVMAEIARTLRNYPCKQEESLRRWDQWQFEKIADLIRPVCYQNGRCGFMAKFDRSCNIRERVEERAMNGATDTNQWSKPFVYDKIIYDDKPGSPRIECKTSPAINDWEWAADPAAARK